MRPWVGAVAGVAVLALGCASSFSGRGEPADREPDEVKRRVLELQRKVTVTEIELERLRRQVAELEERVRRGSGESAAVSPAGTAREPAAPPPRLEAREPAVVEGMDLELEPPVAPPVATPPPLAPPPPAADPSREVAAAEPVTEAAQSLYDRGYTLYHQGLYVDAESSFQRFLQSFGATDLADNAQYWIGESRFARRDLPGALAAFREVVERFPEGNKVPDALLKVGDTLGELGDTEGARESYAEVSKRFPASAAAAMAEERRAALR